MGGDPATGALIAGMLGSSVLGGITAPQGQKLSSFAGDINGGDPHELMRENKGLLDDYLGALISKANEPVTLHTTAKNLPSFKGGALPMQISVPGGDDNRMNPSLRTTPGMNIPRRRLGGVPPAAGTFPGGGSADPGGPPDDYAPIGGDHDPNQQASAALDLIMKQISQPPARSTF